METLLAESERESIKHPKPPFWNESRARMARNLALAALLVFFLYLTVH